MAGMDSNEPMPRASRARPSCPALMSRCRTTAGMRETQAPTRAPLAVNTRAVPVAAARSPVLTLGAAAVSTARAGGT
ncbi:hypothetical protein GCM10022255_017550 [Dactylosporangium darangshiense]|uniref:Uncharacterized protein n=1 Tax=Dactylosporangium darangshiense TaxID=579108 RepID=A0ABP8D2L2_9ACTN